MNLHSTAALGIPRTAIVSLVAATLLVVGVGSTTDSAHADNAQHVYNTGGQGLWLHPDSATVESDTSVLMPEADEFNVSCWQNGDDVNGDSVWDYGEDSSTGDVGYAADFYIDTPVTRGNEGSQLTAMGVPECAGAVGDPSPADEESTVSYDRQAAADWATANVTTPPSFASDDCTWFVTQALWAGGLPSSSQWNGDSWDLATLASRSHYPGPTQTAVYAPYLVNYLVSSGLATETPIRWSDNTAAGAQVGDIIAYDWNQGTDATIDHLALVTKVDANGYPHVSQHTEPRLNRFWSWDPGANSWIQYSHRGVHGDPTAYLIRINALPNY